MSNRSVSMKSCSQNAIPRQPGFGRGFLFGRFGFVLFVGSVLASLF